MTTQDQRPRLSAIPRISKMDPVSRRDFIRLLGLGAAGTVLAACGTGGSTTTAAAGGGTTTTAGGGSTKLIFANWPFYIDPGGEDSYFETSTLQDFEEATGISVDYIEEINDNDEWFGKVQGALSAGQSIDRDLAAVTDWMVARFIRLGWAEKLDRANIPNAANVIDSLASPGFDPGRDYTLPWQAGLTAIGYDPERTGGELTSINDIFDPALSGRVTMLTEMRDTLGLTMLGMGIDPAQATVADAEAAVAKLQGFVDNGHIRRFTGNDYGDDLVSGNVWAAFAWSGDVIQLQADNPNLRFLIPEEGLMQWADNMFVPKGAANKANAETFMNYVYEPRVAAKIESWVNYICPVKGAQQAMRDLGAEEEDEDLAALAEEPLIFPDEATLAKTHIFKSLDEDEELQFNEMFQALIGA